MMIICYFFFSPADISFLRSISLSISLEILSSVIRAYPCVVLILECPIILAILSMGISAEIKKVPKLCRAAWNIQGEASNNEQVKIKRKSFEMSCISVFCKMWKMQTTTEY